MIARALACPILVLLLTGCSAFPRADVDRLRFLSEEPSTPESLTLTLTFFEVGLGDAILAELPGGRTLLIDAGIGWRVEGILEYLEAKGIRRLDGLLLSHPHPDHYGGMARIVESVTVGTFYHNGVCPKRRSFARLEAALDARGVPRRVLARGDRLDELAGGRTSIEVLYPDRPALERGGNKNHGSIVLSLAHGSRRFLFTGDSERAEEKRLLLLEGHRLRHHFLKLGHHASPGSGSEDFLRAVRPELAIAQGTGLPNVPLFYPRPNYRIRRVLRDVQATVLTTEREGAIQVISDGESLRIRSMARIAREKERSGSKLGSSPPAPEAPALRPAATAGLHRGAAFEHVLRHASRVRRLRPAA